MSFLFRNYRSFNPPSPPKSPNPVRFGILGAANIGPNALISPALSHPDVEVVAVGARDKKKAEDYAKNHKIKKAYEGYDAVLQDPDIDAIYTALPNGLHYEWTLKALAAGKHVLLEKPACNNTAEVERVFELAKEKGLIVLEAFHYRFHPAPQRLKEIVDSGEIGAIKKVIAHFAIPKGVFVEDDDIRFKYHLGGGATMDLGCYVTSVCRYLIGTEPVSVVSATPILQDAVKEPFVDRGMSFVYSFPSSITAECLGDLGLPPWGPLSLLPRMVDVTVKVVGEDGEAELLNFAGPTVYHYITVTGKNGRRTEKAYAGSVGSKGEAWWTTYRFQLEAFVDKVKGREPQMWISPEDSIAQARCLDMVYEKSGLGLRPTSEFKL